MQINPLLSKSLVVGIILFFVGTCIIPSIKSELTLEKKIITVDDEPGDADFTLIKEAVNYSSPGDIIEVYSGTYPEDGILIAKENISLLGISHELGEGNDSGKPFVRGNGTETVIQVEASHVIVSNFIIENPWSDYLKFVHCISVGNQWVVEQYNNTISDCIIRNSTREGIFVLKNGNTKIINNHLSHCEVGIYVASENSIISGNIITDCCQSGIVLFDDLQNVSGNRIKRCEYGIEIYRDNNIIFGNDIESCSVGIYASVTFGNIITKNNFKNYSRGVYWWLISYEHIFLIFKKDRWIENYWDTCIGVGPKIILGQLILPSEIIVPWFDFDWRPAKKPYDIPDMS